MQIPGAVARKAQYPHETDREPVVWTTGEKYSE